MRLGAAWVAIGVALWACGLARGEEAPVLDLKSDTWVATDALGRTLPGYRECGPVRPGKTVGIFYFLWHGPEIGTPIYDNTKLLAADPGAPKYGPLGAFHWWGEPWMGYYSMQDPFVIRRHAQMLTNAGVDVIVLDVTNSLTYDSTFLRICEVYRAMRAQGLRTPQLAFMAHSGAPATVRRLYDDFYAKNLYPELWFRWKGKPLVLAGEEPLPPPLADFFTVRRCWAWTKGFAWFGDGRDAWAWVDHTPQQPGWHESPDRPEQISVSVAEHATSNMGRSFHTGHQPAPDAVTPERGLYFDEQWKRAREVDPEFVFVTGWNEWIAQRFANPGGQPFLGVPGKPGDTFFVDQYNEEFSRDIEPMRGGHGDDYYYQLVANIRRYKGVRAPEPAGPRRTIRLDGGFTQWANVRPDYRDDAFDTTPRDFPGWGTMVYRNATGRNDFVLARVARDTANLYFYIRTREPITPPSGASWMLLLLDVDGSRKTGWEGYDFVVNRARTGGSRCSVERNVGGGWQWKEAGAARYAVAGNELMIAIPRSALGLQSTRGPLRIDFKWVDNLPDTPTAMDFIDQGDTAPNGRFNYRYQEK